METATLPSKKEYNVRGRIGSLADGENVVVPRSLGYKPSYVRIAAAIIAQDTGKKFSVKTTDETITVTRIK